MHGREGDGKKKQVIPRDSLYSSIFPLIPKPDCTCEECAARVYEEETSPKMDLLRSYMDLRSYITWNLHLEGCLSYRHMFYNCSKKNPKASGILSHAFSYKELPYTRVRSSLHLVQEPLQVSEGQQAHPTWTWNLFFEVRDARVGPKEHLHVQWLLHGLPLSATIWVHACTHQ